MLVIRARCTADQRTRDRMIQILARRNLSFGGKTRSGCCTVKLACPLQVGHDLRVPDGQFRPLAHDSRRTHLSFFNCPRGGAIQRGGVCRRRSKLPLVSLASKRTLALQQAVVAYSRSSGPPEPYFLRHVLCGSEKRHLGN